MAASESHTGGFAKVRQEAGPAPSQKPDYWPLVADLRRNFEAGKTKDLEWRRQQLRQCMKMIEESHEEITAAVRADHGGPKLRGIAELGGIHKAAETALAKLDEWTAPIEVATPITVSMSRLGKSYIRQEPKGVLLIIGPWNFPFELTLHPLVSAIAAGCCVVIKPSEVAKNSGAMVEKLISKYLDTSCIKVVQGAVPETQALLEVQWDHIFYTGNGHVGRVVLRAAAEHLTPVTLELGGKSPVIIDKSAKMTSVVGRVSSAKWLNAGQICIAPDYVLVHKDREEEFIAGMKQQLKDSYGADPKASPDYGRVINASHVHRISGLLEKTQGEVVVGGMSQVDPQAHYIPPTIVRGCKMGEPLLTEEIFGPVLPVIAVDDMEDAVRKVKEVCDRPLALYVYAEDGKASEQVLNNTISGGGCVNSSLEHIMVADLPFGGVGGSGYGSYHGKAGFDEFTHQRGILHQDTLLQKGPAAPPPPYKDSIYDLAVKATITGFLTDSQRDVLGHVKSVVGAAALGAAAWGLRSRL